MRSRDLRTHNLWARDGWVFIDPKTGQPWRAEVIADWEDNLLEAGPRVAIALVTEDMKNDRITRPLNFGFVR